MSHAHATRGPRKASKTYNTPFSPSKLKVRTTHTQNRIARAGCAFLSSPALDVRLMTALQVLQVRARRRLGGRTGHARSRREREALTFTHSSQRKAQSVSTGYTPPSMEDGPTHAHTRCTRLAREPTRGTLTGLSTGSGLLDTQHTAHRTAHETRGGAI